MASLDPSGGGGSGDQGGQPVDQAASTGGMRRVVKAKRPPLRDARASVEPSEVFRSELEAKQAEENARRAEEVRDAADFLPSVERAYSRFKDQGTGDAKFESVYSFCENETEELQEKLALGGDPTLGVSSLPRTHSSPAEALGFGRAVLADEDRYGVGVIDDDYLKLNSPPGSPSWAKFAAVRNYFTDKDDLRCSDLEDPATYAASIGIAEPPVAVALRTAWGNGCKLTALLCTESHIYTISYTNG